MTARIAHDRAETVASLHRFESVLDGHDGNLDGLRRVVETNSAEIAQVEARTTALAGEMATIDVHELDLVRDQLSATVGEVTLVRIEMDRFTADLDDKLARYALRLSATDAKLADQHADTASSVQLDRLDELERAILELDPDQFVRREPLDADPPPDRQQTRLSDVAPSRP